MPYRLLPDVAIADIAFEADSKTINGLFEACAIALTEIMVDLKTLRGSETRKISVTSDDLDRLLYDFLTELIVVKDVDSMLFRDFKVSVAPDRTTMTVTAKGEPIDRERHVLRNAVKAGTMHMFGVSNVGKKWTATVVLDI